MRKGKLECEYRDIDRCDRMVAACAIGDVDLGQEIVKVGLAFAYRCFSMSYDLDEKNAAVRRVGLQAHEVLSPSEYRRAGARQADTTFGSCAMEVNISRSGARIHHLPGQKDYADT